MATETATVTATATLTTKGQVTIPIEVRRELGLKTGDRIQFKLNPETGCFELGRKTGSIKDLFGILKYDGPTVSIEEMNEAMGQETVRQYLRSTEKA